MSLPKMTRDLNFVSGLANQPTESAEELKHTFDLAGNALKDYINEDLLPALDKDFLKITGGILNGDIQTLNIYPRVNKQYNIGTSVRTYNQGYINQLVQEVSLNAKKPTQGKSNHAFGFAWGQTTSDHPLLRIAIDRDEENYFIPVSKDHVLELRWTGSGLACFVDGTFVGNVKLEK